MAAGPAPFPSLKRNEQRGSKPRCHLLTHGPAPAVAERLSRLCAPFATVSPTDQWMPKGFEVLTECQLHKRSPVLNSVLCEKLAAWWLPERQTDDRTPNIDIAATCSIGDRPGLLLIEAKAHDQELIHESAGRRLHATDKAESQARREASHKTIGKAIAEAKTGLSTASGLTYQISRDTCYQMSNRFAWSWKLAAEGIPVVLIYLGFLDADDMADKGKPFRSHQQWEDLVKDHGDGIVPRQCWESPCKVNGQTFVPIIRTLAIPLTPFPHHS